MKRGALLDLLLTRKEGLIGNMKVKCILGCSEHEVVEFSLLRRGSRVKSKPTTLDFRRAVFGFFKDQLGDTCGIKPWREEGPKKVG